MIMKKTVINLECFYQFAIADRNFSTLVVQLGVVVEYCVASAIFQPLTTLIISMD